MNSEVKKVTYNTGAQLLGKAFSVLTTITTTAIIARKLGEVDFAAFFLMTGFATYFYLLTDFGINAIVTRELSLDGPKTEKMSRYFNNLLTFRVGGALIMILLLTLVVPLIPFRLSNLSTLKLGVTIGLVTILAQAVYNSCTAIFQSTLSYQKLVVASVAGNAAFLVLVVILVWRDFRVLPLVVANSLGTLIVAGVSLYLVGKAVGSVRFKFDFGLWKKLIVTSLPLGIGIVLTVIVAKADQFLLAVLPLGQHLNLTNDVALANYGLAYKIFENILVFPTYFVNSVYPLLVKNYRQDLVKLKKIFWTAFYFMLSTSLIISWLGWQLSPLVIKIIGGQGFTLAPLSLRILLLSLPLFFTSSLFLFLMVVQNQQQKIPYVYLLAAVFNVISNLLFIPRYGFLASAVITGLTEFLILTLVAYFGLKSLRVIVEVKD